METSLTAVGMEIIFYTDPLCCWTWAMQPQWNKFINELSGNSQIIIKYKMGGLIPSWRHFHDQTASIDKPVQMGPEWMHAAAVSGVKINHGIWISDPPASSFPACIAVKCVELQSPPMAVEFLYMLQEAVMAKGLNIARTTVLIDLATTLRINHPTFDVQRFQTDLLGENGKESFKIDLQECKYLGITRMPTLRFKSSLGRSGLLTCYQSYDSLTETYHKMV